MSAGWNTIESDAGVFTFLVNNLGVQDVQFEELVALDGDYLRQLGPVYGVTFLFKYPTGETKSGSPKDGTYDFEAAENLFFAAQTIQNACGTQALLSVLLNKEGEVQIGPQLREFKEFTGAFPSEVNFGFGDVLFILVLLWVEDAKANHHGSLSVARRSALELRTHPRRPQLLRPLLPLR